MKIQDLKHAGLKKWLEDAVALMTPDSVEICDGTKAEYDRMIKILVDGGLATPLKARPNSYLFRSDPSDVARAESRTFIAAKNKIEAGPNNNWTDPVELKKTMSDLYKGCMKGRVMYAIPFSDPTLRTWRVRKAAPLLPPKTKLKPVPITTGQTR